MPLLKGKSKETIAENVRRLIAEGYSSGQAVAIAHAKAREDRTDSRKRPKSPGTAAPTKIERQYFRFIDRLLREVHKSFLVAAKPIIEEAKREDLEAQENELYTRKDGGAEERLLGVIRRLREGWITTTVISTLSKFAQQIDNFETNQVKKQFERIVSIDAFPASAAKDLVESWVKKNTELISRTIQETVFDGIEKTVKQNFAEGRSVVFIERELLRRYDLHEDAKKAKTRARLIARDQTGKLTSSVRKHRHEKLGVTKYQWSTSGDERVRDRHQELDGKIFTYERPPLINKQGDRGHPGDDYQCFLPSTIVQGSFVGGIASYYDGYIIDIYTGHGGLLSITPNHPILTRRGLVPARSLVEGDALARFLENDEPITAEKAFQFIARMGPVEMIDLESGHLHGDAAFVESRSVKAKGYVGVLPERSYFDLAVLQAQRDEIELRAPSRLDSLVSRMGEAMVYDSVREIKVRPYTGVVYDYQTASGLMVADGLVVSNCRCVAIPILPGDDEQQMMDDAYEQQMSDYRSMKKEYQKDIKRDEPVGLDKPVRPLHPSDPNAKVIPEAVPYIPR